MVRVSGPTFTILFMVRVRVRVRVRVISGYGVMLNMCTAVRIKLQTVLYFFSSIMRMKLIFYARKRVEDTYSFLTWFIKRKPAFS